MNSRLLAARHLPIVELLFRVETFVHDDRVRALEAASKWPATQEFTPFATKQLDCLATKTGITCNKTGDYHFRVKHVKDGKVFHFNVNTQQMNVHAEYQQSIVCRALIYCMLFVRMGCR
jgi:hypothetical protein